MRYVVDYKKRRLTKDKLSNRILEEFESTNGQVAIASTSMDISVVEAPQVDIKVRNQVS